MVRNMAFDEVWSEGNTNMEDDTRRSFWVRKSENEGQIGASFS